MNTLIKISIACAIGWIACIIGIIIWANMTIQKINKWDITTETLPSAAWGIPLLSSLGFILFIVFLVTLIIGLSKKK